MNYKKTAKAASSLVVIASVFLAIPAEAESYKRIQDNEGIVYDGLAYKDGIFYIDGEVNQLGEGNFHLSDGKYIKLKKINSGDNFNLYGEKYLEIENGDYYVDLNTGKIIDDNIESKLEYAFNENLGYLMESPKNIGTGLEASIDIHLPALTMNNEIDKISKTFDRLGMSIKSIYNYDSEK